MQVWRNINRPASRIALASLLLTGGVVAASSVHAANFTVLHAFDGGPNDGDTGVGFLVINKQGNLEGATKLGGAQNFGMLFTIDPAGNYSPETSFTKRNAGYPNAGVARDGDVLYGTVSYDTLNYAGGIFKINKSKKILPLYLFCSQRFCADGQAPQYGVVQRSQYLYGTALQGGKYQAGTVFKFDLTTGGLTVLHHFCAGGGICTDGAYPTGGLVPDSEGNLYGTTQGGGAAKYCGSGQYPCGTVFKIDSSGKFHSLYSFKGPDNGDGVRPYATPIFDRKGNLYGATLQGGGSGCGGDGCGIIYKIDPSGNETVLYSFKGGPTDGALPAYGLVLSHDSLYSATVQGGASDAGTVFKVDMDGTETLLHEFTGGSDGYAPEDGLIKGRDGNLYGMTQYGGNLDCPTEPQIGCGVVYRIIP